MAEDMLCQGELHAGSEVMPQERSVLQAAKLEGQIHPISLILMSLELDIELQGLVFVLLGFSFTLGQSFSHYVPIPPL